MTFRSHRTCCGPVARNSLTDSRGGARSNCSSPDLWTAFLGASVRSPLFSSALCNNQRVRRGHANYKIEYHVTSGVLFSPFPVPHRVDHRSCVGAALVRSLAGRGKRAALKRAPSATSRRCFSSCSSSSSSSIISGLSTVRLGFVFYARFLTMQIEVLGESGF